MDEWHLQSSPASWCSSLHEKPFQYKTWLQMMLQWFSSSFACKQFLLTLSTSALSSNSYNWGQTQQNTWLVLRDKPVGLEQRTSMFLLSVRGNKMCSVPWANLRKEIFKCCWHRRSYKVLVSLHPLIVRCFNTCLVLFSAREIPCQTA